MKCALVGVQGKELQRRHAPPQACNSPCSLTHPARDTLYRNFFHLIQQNSNRMERSTAESKFIKLAARTDKDTVLEESRKENPSLASAGARIKTARWGNEKPRINHRAERRIEGSVANG
ncbi:MAG: hypothetical protein N0C88_06325 [Candidatus Thiodiazotropha lotti]|nr:hypothetical protein [Candidatus Thiodiazotropha lotti]